MPEIITHNYFANDVFQKTKKSITNTFKENHNIYELFAQGFDPFFFYELLPFHERLGKYCHTHYTDTFFLNFIKQIKEHKLQNSSAILASLYGHLTHYILDSTAHPYIIYKTGFYDKNKPTTLKYNGLHTKREHEIDAYIYEQNNHLPYKNFKIHKHLITKFKLDKELIHLLNKVYEETFSIKNGGIKYQKGYRSMYYFYKYGIEDKTGIKKTIYHIIDKLIPRKEGIYINFSTHITNIDISILNDEHYTWNNPCDKNLTSTESFFDLYDKALTNCIELFEATHNFLHDKITEEEYKKVLKDNSYLTGLSWHIKEDIKYLEF